MPALKMVTEKITASVPPETAVTWSGQTVRIARGGACVNQQWTGDRGQWTETAPDSGSTSPFPLPHSPPDSHRRDDARHPRAVTLVPARGQRQREAAAGAQVRLHGRQHGRHL